MLPDGTYDALVVDAEPAPEPGAAERIVVDLVLLSGPHKGDVVTVHAPGAPTGDEIDLLGIPATLVVADGAPSITFEP